MVPTNVKFHLAGTVVFKWLLVLQMFQEYTKSFKISVLIAHRTSQRCRSSGKSASFVTLNAFYIPSEESYSSYGAKVRRIIYLTDLL